MSKRSISDVLSTRNCPIKIPQLGFGVYLSPANQTVQSCLTALKLGYRQIDTAQYYGNEAEVGEAVKQSALSRHELVLCTKILSPTSSVESDYEKCIQSVQKLDGGAEGYVDIFLIHSPHSGSAKRKQMWQALERLFEEGKVKSIGVSNFGIKHIEELKSFAKIWPPHVNQLELHPWSQQKEIVAYCEQQGIAIQAYCPLVRNSKANDPCLQHIAQKHGVSPNQVLLRYALQRNWSPLPKSDNPERIKLNAELYGFNLSEEDMKALNDLDQGAAGAIVEAARND